MATMRILLSEVDLEPVSAGDVVYPPGGRLGPRWQHDIQLVLVHSGYAHVTVDEVTRPCLRAASVGLLLPGHREHFAFADGVPTRHSWVQARLHAPSETLTDRLAALPVSLPASTALTELVPRSGRGLAHAAVDRTSAAGGARRGFAVALRGEGESRVPGSGDIVDRARRFLHARYADPEVDLPQVAAAANASTAHLVRRFRAEVGVTPMAYLWQRRVAIGIDLLTSTGLPVGDVAARSGFKSVYHFSRRVKQHAGVSPTQLRRDRWRRPGSEGE